MHLLKLFLISVMLATAARAQVDQACWVAGDGANLASELTADATSRKLQNVLDYLRIGTERCRDRNAVADAWYYRGLLEKHLASQAPAAEKEQALSRSERYLERAKDAGSLAAKEAWPLFGSKRTEEPIAAATGPVREKWALVVGVGTFKSAGVPALKYTGKDARDFANALVDPSIGKFKPQNVTVLIDQDATLVKVRTAIGAIRTQAQRDDLVVVYISSHGSPRSTDPSGVSYVVLHDTDVSGGDTIYATGLAMSEIVSTLNRDVKANRLALFLDTCYSGAAAPGAQPPGARALLPVGSTGVGTFSQAFSQFNAAGWVVVAASQGDQRSWESAELQQGYFTHFLLQQLKATQGQATIEQLFRNLRDQVSSQVLKDRNAQQTPVMSTGAEGSKLILGVESRG